MRLWTQGVGAIARGADVTRLGAMSHGVEIFATELMWRRRGSYLGDITGGAELSASCCDAEVLSSASLEGWAARRASSCPTLSCIYVTN